MRWGPVLALVGRDLAIVRRSRATMLPIIIVPLIISAALPALFGSLPRLAPDLGGAGNEIATFLANLPEAARSSLAGLSEPQVAVVFMGVYMFAPLFLILPLMVAGVIAADSIAGERERKTLEALLYTPLTDGEILVAKTLASWVPALLVTLASFAVYSIVLNVAAWPTMGRIFFPTPMWLVLIAWVAPAIALLALGATVLVSLRVRTVQEATQLSGVLVLPIVALVVTQVRGGMFLGTRLVAIMGLAVWIIALALLHYGSRTFRRSKLVEKV